ncbi:rCG61217 [Rattus norvegicus]|uniref:RCG61217 n=1 Tax=Rattus norvegicus TaxID=10116 RepID=A6KE34_RAT|nr:rCG61217 [Rattus norvegicus]
MQVCQEPDWMRVNRS